MAMYLQWMAEGLLAFSWWQIMLVGLVTTHATIVAVTVYLHRCQTHRALTLHPFIAHAFRFWLWLTTGMVTREWVAVHRCHHAHCETDRDPHSPAVMGIQQVLWRGAELYQSAAAQAELLERYGGGVPDDWLERRIYSRYAWQGVGLLLVLELALFGLPALTLWACQMVWIPFFAAGVVNGVGHYAGYRNFDCKERATNILPFGLLIGGEELHNNHHTFPTSARFSFRWFELDIGWLYICVLRWMRLATLRPSRRPLTRTAGQFAPTLATLEQVLSNRAVLMRELTLLTLVVFRAERRAIAHHVPGTALARAKALIEYVPSKLSTSQVQELEQLSSSCAPLQQMLMARQSLETMWQRSSATPSQLLANLQTWCHEAEQRGPRALQRFARHLASYG